MKLIKTASLLLAVLLIALFLSNNTTSAAPGVVFVGAGGPGTPAPGAAATNGGDEAPAPGYDPQPETVEAFEKAIRDCCKSYDIALETGGEELAQTVPLPHWEYEVEPDLVPPGYTVEKVEDDELFEDDYYTFSPGPDETETGGIPKEDAYAPPTREEAGGTSVTVTSYEALKAALEENNGYTHIYLGADIAQGSAAGIAIHASKASVVIDGRPEGSARNATFTQKVSAVQSQVIYVALANTTTKSVTLRNIDITGNNLFGVVTSYAGVSGLALTYENISYAGPQLTYNRGGSAHYSNCTVNLFGVIGGGDVTGELAEAAQVSFSGTVTVTANNSPNSIIWLTGTATKVKLLSGSVVRMVTNHYLIYADASYPAMVLEAGARLDYTGGYYGLTFADQRLESLVMEPGSALNITQVTNIYANGSIRVNSVFQMQEGSSLYVNRAGGGPAIQMMASGASLIFNNPERVLLYAPSSRLIAFLLTGTMQITTDAVNLWKTTAGFVSNSIDSNPTHVWNRAENQRLVIDSSFVVTTQTLSSNLDANDLTDNLTAATFAVGASQMLVFGRFSLSVNNVYEDAGVVGGLTEHGAALRVTHNNEAIGSGVAESSAYSVALSATPPAGSTLYVTAHHNYLQKRERAVVQTSQDGVLRLVYVPPTLNFGTHTIPEETTVLWRPDNEAFHVAVEDTRGASSRWQLLLSVTEPLTAYRAGKQYILENGLAYVDNSGAVTFLRPNEPILVAQGNASQEITWAPDEGLTLYVNPSVVVSAVHYSTTIDWSLQDAP